MEFFAGWRREEGPWVPASPYGYLVAETVLTSISLVPAVGMLFWALRSGQKHDNAMHEPFGYLKIALLLFTMCVPLLPSFTSSSSEAVKALCLNSED